MATRREFIQYVADQLAGAGTITCRKMFGEYGVYCDGKICALVCDDTLYVKITEAGRALAPQMKEAPPYEGAKPYFLVEDVDDRAFLAQLIRATCDALPPPKPRRSSKRA